MCRSALLVNAITLDSSESVSNADLHVISLIVGYS